MITIISGTRDSGKSTFFLRRYNEAGEAAGVGIVAVKLYDSAAQVAGYNLRLLPGGEEIPFIRLREEANLYTPGSYIMQGRFLFLQSAFESGVQHILLHTPAKAPVWVDEIGKLELQGLGYAGLLRDLFREKRELTIVIRDIYVSEFLSAFPITDYNIINVSTPSLPY